MNSLGKHGVVSMLVGRLGSTVQGQSPSGVVGSAAASGSRGMFLRDLNSAAYEWFEQDDPQPLIEVAGGMLAQGFITSKDFDAILEATGKGA